MLVKLAASYYAFIDVGTEVTLASHKGGQPPIDSKSDEPDSSTETTHRFEADCSAMQVLAHTKKLSEVSMTDFEAVFYPDGLSLIGFSRRYQFNCPDQTSH